MRKMATIRRIDNIRPIPDADAIECAVVGGWTVVVKKNEFKAGELAVYCEIDSWIPNSLAPFLSKGQEPREYEGIKGERLRTVRLRGQLSQGLLLKAQAFSYDSTKCMLPFAYAGSTNEKGDDGSPLVSLGDDVSEMLSIVKYEPPIPAQLAGEVKGLFPGFIPKTDQERIQNLTAELAEWQAKGGSWEVTEKLDGSSMTCYIRDGEFGVCSRNLELKRNLDNTLWNTAWTSGIEEILTNSKRNLALQGELIGEGIQGNPYKIKGHQFKVFDIYDIDQGRYFTPRERIDWITDNDTGNGLDHVPVIDTVSLTVFSVNKLLEMAEGRSVLHPNAEREGLVFKRQDGAASFKAISNKFLIKNDN